MLYKKSNPLKIIAVLIVMLALAGCVSSGNNASGGAGTDVNTDERKIITGLTTSVEESGAV